MSEWTEDRFGFAFDEGTVTSLYGQSEVEYPYYELAEALNDIGFSAEVVPQYMPSGYSVASVISRESTRGFCIICTLANNDREIILSYLLMTEEPARVFAKDDVSPETYIKNGIEHYIFTNEGNYRTTWINKNVQCEIQEVAEKEELLKMIDSIYEER